MELDISGIAGLALDGPGPPDVARSLVVALLAKGGPRVVQVLIPDATAAPLPPGVAGEGRFGPAEDVIQVPPAHPSLAYVLSAMAGHLFGSDEFLCVWRCGNRNKARKERAPPPPLARFQCGR